MKFVGKIFLLVTGILFLIWGIWGLTDVIKTASSSFNSGDWTIITAWIVAALLVLFELLAGLGGIFYFIGHGPFRGFVGPFAVINFVLIIFELVLGIINKDSLLWMTTASTVTSVVYFLGWVFARK